MIEVKEIKERVRFIHTSDRVICLLTLPSGMGFMGLGTHNDEKEAERLAYADALEKSKVISIKNIALFRDWKRQHQHFY